MRILYVSPMPYGANAAVDAICHGIESRLAANGRRAAASAYADFADPDWRAAADRAVRAGADAGFDAIVIWVIDPATPADAVGYARGPGRARGQPGAAAVRRRRRRWSTRTSTTASTWPSTSPTLLPPGARVAVVGGPDVVDDIELLLGIRHGLDTSGLARVNDPEDPRYKNTTDVASGGKEKTANLLADFGQPGRAGPVQRRDAARRGRGAARGRPARRGQDGLPERDARPRSSWSGPGFITAPGTSTRSASAQTVADLAIRASGPRGPGRALRVQPDRANDHRRARRERGSPGSERIPYNPLKLAW